MHVELDLHGVPWSDKDEELFRLHEDRLVRRLSRYGLEESEVLGSLRRPSEGHKFDGPASLIYYRFAPAWWPLEIPRRQVPRQGPGYSRATTPWASLIRDGVAPRRGPQDL
jgi:hypothetical protein